MKSLLVPCLLLLASCTPSPADCVDKGDIAACRKLCETGEEEFTALCFEERARQVEACLDKGTDCDTACGNWKGLTEVDVAWTVYRAKLGTDARVAQMEQKCGG